MLASYKESQNITTSIDKRELRKDENHYYEDILFGKDMNRKIESKKIKYFLH
jgi:hypothetical protein